MRRLLLLMAVMGVTACGGGIGAECTEDEDCAAGLVCENVLQCVAEPCPGAWQCTMPSSQ